MSALQRPIRFDLCGTGLIATWEPILETCLLAERLGYNAFHASDHILPASSYSRFGDYLEAWSLLAALAARTERIRLGAMVTGNTYRHPVMLAKMVTNVDIISHGRVDFGIGTGWSALDHLPYGIPYPPFAERAERLDEAVTLIRMLWTRKTSDFAGRHYRLVDAPFEPKPVQKPHPPFLIGGSSRAVLKVVARQADIWNGLGSMKFVARTLQRLDLACAEAGRDPAAIERSLWTDFVITANAAETDAAVRQRVGRSEAAQEDPRKKYGLPEETLEEIVRGATLIGTPEQIRDQVRRFIALGITRFVLRNPRPFDQVAAERFAKEVVAAFA